MKFRFLLPLLLLAAGVRAESAKGYQVTGPIVALTDNVITVQKGDEKWEIGRSASTKVDGKLAVGSKVTVYYKMTATDIESKEAPAKAPEKKTEKATEKADKKAEKAAEKADKKAKS